MPTHFLKCRFVECIGRLFDHAELLSLPFHKAVGELELIENALRLASGNRTEAANRLQINRRLLYQK